MRAKLKASPVVLAQREPSGGLDAPHRYGQPQAEPLPVFTFPETGQTLRVTDLEGNHWFDGTDACRNLAMDVSAGTSRWLRALAPDEKRLVTRKEHPQLFCGSFASTRTLISESGLYKLIMRSDKPVARKFQDWVTREVLPAIRRKGGYVMGEEKLRTGEMSTKEYLARALVVAHEKKRLSVHLSSRERHTARSTRVPTGLAWIC